MSGGGPPVDAPAGLRYLPVGLDLRGRPCVVVGGGTIGARKVLTLERAGARVTLVSPEATEDARAEAAARKHEQGQRRDDRRGDAQEGSLRRSRLHARTS